MLRSLSRLSRLSSLAVEGLVEALWPARCLACDEPAGFDPRLCDDCALGLARLVPRQCRVCARPLLDTMPEERCEACSRRRPPFSRLTAFGPYEGARRALVSRLKFTGLRVAAGPLAQGLVRCELLHRASHPEEWCDAVVPLPLAPSRERQRGFNQSRLLAEPVAAALAVPLRPDVLVRRGGGRQLGRSRAERRRLGVEAFAAGGGYGARLLLIDDVVTTGATLRAATRALLAAGARDVRCLVAARTD
ncbi:MAG: double zinc ribbon domain-containing protein [Planctomycetota bacterium]